MNAGCLRVVICHPTRNQKHLLLDSRQSATRLWVSSCCLDRVTFGSDVAVCCLCVSPAGLFVCLFVGQEDH